MDEPIQPMGCTRARKQLLRERILADRLSLPDRALGDAARTAALLAHPLVRAARVVAAYASFDTEPDTTGLRRELAARGVTVLLPILAADRSLSFAPAAPPGAAPMPLAAADVVLVPALAVDRTGLRLGRGGGSYDRALASLRRPVLALLHPGELLERVPAEPHDERVSAVVLPGGVVWLGR